MAIFLNRGIDLLGKIQSLNRNVNFIWGQKLKEFLTTILEQACFFWATRIFWKLATILYLVKKDFLNIVFKGGKPAPEWVLNSVVKCESECKLFLPDRRIFSKLFLKLFCQLHSNRDVDFLPDFFQGHFASSALLSFGDFCCEFSPKVIWTCESSVWCLMKATLVIKQWTISIMPLQNKVYAIYVAI